VHPTAYQPRGGGSVSPRESSLANGLLQLSAATFLDQATPLVLSATQVYNGVEVELQNGATATPQSISGAATWTWPVGRDMLGNSLSVAHLINQRWILGLLERSFVDALPLQVCLFAGFSSTSTPQAAAGQGLAVELAYPSTDLRRVAIHTRNAGAWARVAGGTGQNTCFGVELMGSGNTHVLGFQHRAYPLDASYDRSSAVGTNTATAGATTVDLSAMTHFFVGVGWDAAVAGTPKFTFDAAFGIWPRVPWV
jgi:hypothetical protein